MRDRRSTMGPAGAAQESPLDASLRPWHRRGVANKPPAAAPERSTTPRAAIYEALLGGALTSRDISSRTSVREKDVAMHLEHLERSVKQKGERLVIKPAECLACGFVFRDRQRFTAPGSCPKCRSERISAPAFRIEAKGKSGGTSPP